jgi:hypothetical protein
MRKEGLEQVIDKARYIEAKGLICPYCGGESVEGRFIWVEAGEAFQAMRCSECGNQWQDVYHLVDVLPLVKEE